MITDNLNKIQSQITSACLAAGREEKEVTLIAVSKTRPVSDIEELYRAGHRDFGENYVQELREKQQFLPEDIRWHMIGHLQKNKVKYIAAYISMIHSVDSEELARVIEKEAAKHNRIIPVLIEVNIAGEETKYGLSPEEVPPLLDLIETLPHVECRGFMTSAPPCENSEENRLYFRKMKELSVDMVLKNYNNGRVDILSMGMSGDFDVAVEEGSTMVRVGTSIFGARNYS